MSPVADPLALQTSTVRLAALAVVGAVSLVVGGGLLYDGLRRIRYLRRARTAFEPVDATVVASTVLASAEGARKAVPNVEYEYTVAGETYRSAILWPTLGGARGTVDFEVARRVVEDHPEGATVIARYDPAEPDSAYLLDQVNATWPRLEALVGAGLLLALLALASLVVRGTV